MKKIFIFSLAIIFSLAFFGFVQAAWEEPSTDPPGGNISPPLNQGSTDQYKEGGLLIGDNSVDSLEQGYVFAVAGADAYFLQGVQIDGTLNIDGTLTASGGILVQDSNLTIDNGTLNIDDGNIDLAESTISVIDTTNPIVVYVSSSRSDGIAIRAATLSGTSIYASTGDGIGIHASTTGAGIGIYGVAEDASGIAIAGKAEVVNGLAGRFDGEVRFNPLGSARTEDTTIVGGEIVVTDGSSITTIDGALIEVDDGVGSTIIDGGDVIIDGDLTVVTDAYHIGELLEVGGSTLYADANSDRVGIGTDDPDAKLHVYSSGGSGSTDINLEYNFTGTINGSRDSNWVLRANSSGGKFQIMNPTIDRLVIDTSGNVSIPSYNCSIFGNSGKLTTDVNGQIICSADIGGETGPDDDWTIPGDGNIYRATGNVGIGTDDPNYPLHIVYGDSESPGLFIENRVGDDTADASITLLDDRSETYYTFGVDAQIEDGTDRSFIISDSDSLDSPRFMVENTSGYIGIGTVDPGYNLDVSGDINFTGNLYQNEEEYDGGGGGESDGDWTISGSNLYSAKQGNVGIGVMSPSGKLEVFTEDGQLQQSAIKGRATYSGEKGIWGVNNAGYGVVGESDEYVGVQALSVSGTALMANVESGTIADFRLDDETQVIINNQGNVGIGTTNPGYALDVSDSGNAAMIRIENNNADNKYTGLRLDRDSNAEKWFLGMNDSNDNLRFRSSSSNDYMVIDTSGNIHILNYNCSTLGNSGKLTTNSSGQIICSADIGGGETGGDDDWGGVSGDPTLGGDIYHTGNVGIGTTNPDTLLEISGSGSNMLKITNSDITADTYIGHYVNDSSGNPNGMYITFTRNNTRDAWIGPGSGDNRDFYIANEALDKKIYLSTTPTTQGTDITRMTIDSDGNVGIGTTSPAEKFEVYDGADLLFSVIEGAQEGEMSVNIPGKLNVGTIDPIYVIAEERYATYGHSTIGVKEEVLGKININKKIKENLYQYKIDFSKQEQGSDLWLFNEITDFGLEWENLIVMLTPQGRADVWYEIEAEKDLLIIYSDQLITVSYRLVAPRFDSQEHPTYLPDSDYEGLRVR